MLQAARDGPFQWAKRAMKQEMAIRRRMFELSMTCVCTRVT